MDVMNISAYLLMMGISAVCVCTFFYLSVLRSRQLSSIKALSLSVCVLLLGTVFTVLGAKLFYFIYRFTYFIRQGVLDYWLSVSIEELSYYGGVAGVVFAVFLSAKICGVSPRFALNGFAPWGALMAALARFAECFLFPTGTGALLDDFLPFPLAVWSEDYESCFLAVYMFEGILSLAAFVLSLIHREEPRRLLRTLFYLCLPQIVLESLRSEAINMLFIHLEQLACYIFLEAVFVWYAFRLGRKAFSSWIPAIAGLVVCGIVIACEFAVDGKLRFGEEAIPLWLVYAVMASGLAGLAVTEHRANRRLL